MELGTPRPTRLTRLVRLRPTHRQTGSPTYRQPGGAWDVPTLDAVTGAADVADSRHGADRRRAARLVAAVAGGLRASGVTRGDTVAWQLPNCHRGAICSSGPAGAWGRSPFPVHHLVGAAEVDRMLGPGRAEGPVLPRRAPGRRAASGVRLARGGEPAWEAAVRRSPGRRRPRPGDPIWPWPCSPPARPESPRWCSTATGRSPTRRSRWWRRTGSPPPTRC